MTDYSTSDLIKKWAARVREEYGGAKYSYNNRRPCIDRLIRLFKKYDIEYLDAKMAERKAMEVIITKEGMKGTKDYKNWPKNFKKDYGEILNDYYIDDDTSDIEPLTEMEKAPYWMYADDSAGRIKKWLTDTYGYSDQLYKEARRVGSFFWMEYLDANF